MLVTVLCVWLAVTVNRARRQREAVEAIEAAGGRVSYEYELPKWLLELDGEEYFGSVDFVDFGSTQVTDAGLEHLKGLANLRTLSLQNTQVTDVGLVHLKGLTNLQRLDLYNTKVTDDGVKKLQQALPNCEIHH